eukprot:gene10644-12323_t
MEACLAPGLSFQAPSIDPSTYTPPFSTKPRGCSAADRNRLEKRASTGNSCPHHRGDLMRWEDPSAWGNQGVPRPNTAVSLPQNTKMLVTQCSFTSGNNFRSIYVPSSSQLVFDDADISLVTGRIKVDGKLFAGSPSCRLQSTLSITFLTMQGVAEFDMGIQVGKFGELDLHGPLYTPTWTRLSATAEEGRNHVDLQEKVNWKPGQLVVVVTSVFRDEYTNQNEVMTIDRMDNAGKTVVFTRNLQFNHYGGEEYQSEVGLLSRGITLQSGEQTERTQRGAHVAIMGKAGVEENNWFEHNLAAFIHVIGKPSGGNSQSGSLTVESNEVAQPADAAASGFYAANPNNAFLKNAASGGFSGFNFPRVDRPIRDFRYRNDFFPFTRPLKLFDQNTAHSTGYYWPMAGGIYVGGRLWEDFNDGNKLYYSSGRWEHDTKDDDGNPAFHVFTNNKVWLAQWGISHWGPRAKTIGWEAHDGTRGANMFGEAQISNALINGESGNVWSGFPGNYDDIDVIAGFRWYDTRVMTILSNVTFMNYVFQPNKGFTRQSVWYSMAQSDEFKPATDTSSAFPPTDQYIMGYVAQFGGTSDDTRSVPVTRNEVPAGSSIMFATSYPTGTRFNIQRQYKWYPQYDSWLEQVFSLADVMSSQGEAYYFDQRHLYIKLVDPGDELLADTFTVDGVPIWGNRYFNMWIKSGISQPNYQTATTHGWSPGDATCAQQKESAKCEDNIMFDTAGMDPHVVALGSYCAVTCGRCKFGDKLCTDRNPPGSGRVTCEERATAGQCYEFSLERGNFCSKSCGFNGCGAAVPCTDLLPNDGYSCAQRKIWGDCDASWMISGNLCRKTCGACSPSSPPSPTSGPTPGPAPRPPPSPARSPPPSPVPVPIPGCVDDSSPGGYTCAQQKSWGKCSLEWLSKLCPVTCNTCPSSPPTDCKDTNEYPGGYTCAQQKAWGKCSMAWLSELCPVTCNTCGSSPSTDCKDTNDKPGGYTCAQQKAFGKCSMAWLSELCPVTCNTCPSSPSTDCKDTNDKPGGYTCAQQKAFGKCSEKWLYDLCPVTCNTCPSSPSTDCKDTNEYPAEESSRGGHIFSATWSVLGTSQPSDPTISFILDTPTSGPRADPVQNISFMIDTPSPSDSFDQQILGPLYVSNPFNSAINNFGANREDPRGFVTIEDNKSSSDVYSVPPLAGTPLGIQFQTDEMENDTAPVDPCMCSDNPPTGSQLSCYDLVNTFMACNADWVTTSSTCRASCGHCTMADQCLDFDPPLGASCTAVVAARNCSDPFLVAGGWCRRSCGYCTRSPCLDQTKISLSKQTISADGTPSLRSPLLTKAAIPPPLGMKVISYSTDASTTMRPPPLPKKAAVPPPISTPLINNSATAEPDLLQQTTCDICTDEPPPNSSLACVPLKKTAQQCWRPSGAAQVYCVLGGGAYAHVDAAPSLLVYPLNFVKMCLPCTWARAPLLWDPSCVIVKWSLLEGTARLLVADALPSVSLEPFLQPDLLTAALPSPNDILVAGANSPSFSLVMGTSVLQN